MVAISPDCLDTWWFCGRIQYDPWGLFSFCGGGERFRLGKKYHGQKSNYHASPHRTQHTPNGSLPSLSWFRTSVEFLSLFI
jgi:hypothetical protein